MSQIPETLTQKIKIDDGLDDLIIKYTTSVVENNFFSFEPEESKEQILDELDQLGIQVSDPASLEVNQWKESDILPENIHFDETKIEKITIVQIDKTLFSLRISTKDGYLEEQKFGQGRKLDLKRFHDLLIVNA